MAKNIKTEVSFVEINGRTLSKRTSYHQNGQISEVGTFSSSSNKWGWDSPVGVLEKYFDNGVLQSRVSYDNNGYLHGESQYFNRDGKLLKTQVHSKDKLIEEKVTEAIVSGGSEY